MRNVRAAALAAINRVGRNGQLVLMPKSGTEPGTAYAQDSLWSEHNHEFMADPAFVRAYQRGVKAGGFDYGMHWRVHVALWVAQQASALPGDFVECGVGRGFVSSAVLEYLPWESLHKTMHLFDTFTPHNVQDVSGQARPHYADDLASVRENFQEWPNVVLVPGSVPESFCGHDFGEVAYLHVDMNHPDPEVAAVLHLWPHLVDGGWLLFDDYAFVHCESQKRALDDVARQLGFAILSLPTGQGLAVKSPSTSTR